MIGWNPFSMVVAIVGIVLGYCALVKYMNRGTTSEDDEARRSEAAAMTARLEELEARIRVLERIVTDESAGLRERFRDL